MACRPRRFGSDTDLTIIRESRLNSSVRFGGSAEAGTPSEQRRTFGQSPHLGHELGCCRAIVVTGKSQHHLGYVAVGQQDISEPRSIGLGLCSNRIPCKRGSDSKPASSEAGQPAGLYVVRCWFSRTVQILIHGSMYHEEFEALYQREMEVQIHGWCCPVSRPWLLGLAHSRPESVFEMPAADFCYPPRPDSASSDDRIRGRRGFRFASKVEESALSQRGRSVDIGVKLVEYC